MAFAMDRPEITREGQVLPRDADQAKSGISAQPQRLADSDKFTPLTAPYALAKPIEHFITQNKKNVSDY